MAFYEAKKIGAQIAQKTLIDGENFPKILGRVVATVGALLFVGVGSVALALRVFGY